MEIKINTDELMSVVQAAKELGKPRLTIYRWVENKKIVGIKLGGILFIPTVEVEKMKKELETEAKAPLAAEGSS